MKKRNILFENKVFSTHPNTLGIGSFLDHENNLFRDEEVYVPIEKIKERTESFSELKQLYFYDPVETYFRDLRLDDIKARELNLSFARKVIVDEHYPADGEHWFYPIGFVDTPVDNPFYDDNGPPFMISWGRNSLIQMIGYCRYSEAVPELREVMLHDDSFWTKELALTALGPLDQKKADPVLNEVLNLATDRLWIIRIVEHIGMFAPRKFFIENLRQKFEEHYHDYIGNALGRRYFGTIPQAIIVHVCPRVPTVDSLAIIEEGLKHIYPHVEHNAKYALLRWLKNVVKTERVDEKVFKKACQMAKKYDIQNYEGEVWKHFAKLPVAGPY